MSTELPQEARTIGPEPPDQTAAFQAFAAQQSPFKEAKAREEQLQYVASSD